MLNNKVVSDYLCEVKFDIEQDNDVTFLGDWDKEDIEVCKALETVIKYLEK